MLQQPEAQHWYLRTLQEAQRGGPRGAQQDTALMVGPWEFRPQGIAVATHLWYGEADRETPIAMGRYLAAAIPQSRTHFYPGEGHLSVMVNHLEEILQLFAVEAPRSV